MTFPFDVAEKVILITGAADGIGLEAARELSRRGARIVLVDRNMLAALAAAEALDGPALAITADVTDRAAMQAATEKAISHFGRLDVVVANAGITPPPATFRTGRLEDFDRVIAVNVTGVVNTIYPAIEELIRRQGHIVVVASVAAFCPPIGGASYMVSKAAVEQLGRGLRLELGPHGVSVTVSYFGVVDTRLAQAALDEDPLGGGLNQMLPSFLRKRISPAKAGEVIADAIRQRAAHSMAPKAWDGFAMLRGMLNPLLDRRLLSDKKVRDLLLALEGRAQRSDRRH